MAKCLRWSFAQAALKNRALNLDGLHCQAMTQSQHKLFQKCDIEFKSLICNECILIATSQACARFGKCKVFRHIKRWRWPLAIFGIRIRIDLYFPAAGKGLSKPTWVAAAHRVADPVPISAADAASVPAR